MNVVIYVFVGLLLCKIIGHVTEVLRIGQILGYMIAGIMCGILLGRHEYIEEFSLIAHLSAIFTVFYAGLMSEYRDVFKELKVSVGLSSISVVLSIFLITAYLLILNTPLITALFIATILSNTASETIALIIDRTPAKLRTLLFSASFVDDLIVLIIGTLCISVHVSSTSLLYMDVVYTSIGIVTLFTLFLITMLYIKHQPILHKILNKLFKYMARRSRFFIDVSLLLLSLLVSISLVLNTSPLIYAYISGMLISLGAIVEDPMLKYKLRIIEFSTFLGDLINAIFIPLFFLYIGLLVDISTLNLVLIAGLTVLAILGKLAIYSVYVTLREKSTSMGIKAGFAMCGRGVLELAMLVMGFKAGLLDSFYFNTLISTSLILLIISISTVTLVDLYTKRRQLGP